jgi:hypothetical protein
MERAVFIVVFGAIWLYYPSYKQFVLRILTNILIYIKTTCCVRSSIVLFTTHIVILPANSVVELMVLHDLRLLCCYLFVNLNEIQDIISHNLYIFNKCRIFVCGICLICLTVVLFFLDCYCCAVCLNWFCFIL